MKLGVHSFSSFIHIFQAHYTVIGIDKTSCALWQKKQPRINSAAAKSDYNNMRMKLEMG